MGKLQAAVIFGGQSSEHIVSCMSAVNVIEHIDRTRYDVLLVGITEDGHWIKADSLEDVKTVHGGTKLYQPFCCRTPRRSASSLWTEIRSARSEWMWYSLSFTACTGRTVPSRGFGTG